MYFTKLELQRNLENIYITDTFFLFFTNFLGTYGIQTTRKVQAEK